MGLLRSMDLLSMPTKLLDHGELYSLYDLYLQVMKTFEAFIYGALQGPVRALMLVRLRPIPLMSTSSPKINGGITIMGKH